MDKNEFVRLNEIFGTRKASDHLLIKGEPQEQMKNKIMSILKKCASIPIMAILEARSRGESAEHILRLMLVTFHQLSVFSCTKLEICGSGLKVFCKESHLYVSRSLNFSKTSNRSQLAMPLGHGCFGLNNENCRHFENLLRMDTSDSHHFQTELFKDILPFELRIKEEEFNKVTNVMKNFKVEENLYSVESMKNESTKPKKTNEKDKKYKEPTKLGNEPKPIILPQKNKNSPPPRSMESSSLPSGLTPSKQSVPLPSTPPPQSIPTSSAENNSVTTPKSGKNSPKMQTIALSSPSQRRALSASAPDFLPGQFNFSSVPQVPISEIIYVENRTSSNSTPVDLQNISFSLTNQGRNKKIEIEREKKTVMVKTKNKGDIEKNRWIGRRGECFFFDYIKKRCMRKRMSKMGFTGIFKERQIQVRWLNKKKESGSPFDFIIDYRGEKCYLEVKATTASHKERNDIFFSSNEWNVMIKEKARYALVRSIF